jgi:hypothetical protein
VWAETATSASSPKRRSARSMERMDSRRPPGLRNRAVSSGFGNRCRRSVNHAASASRASALRATSR